MRKTYKEAKFVLVLDSHILEQPREKLLNAEALVMVANSKWNSRLWTYEECVLAEDRLLLQFEDSAMDISRHIAKAAAEKYVDTSYDVYNLTSRYFLGPCIQWAPPCFSASRIHKLLTLQADLQDRQTEDLADEPVCLAALLGMDVKIILQSAKDKRMGKFWRLVQDVPADFVFWARDTLDIPRLRWAPKTFLAGLRFVGASSVSDRRGIYGGPDGLLVVFPGWILGCSPGTHIAASFTFVRGADRPFGVTCYTKEVRAAIIKKRGTDNPFKLENHSEIFDLWDTIGEVPNSNTELALITQNNIELTPYLEYTAALVIVTRVEGNIRYVKKVCAVTIKKQPLETINPKAQNTLQKMRQQGEILPPAWTTTNDNDSIPYSDFMSGIPTKGGRFWYVD